MSSFIEELKANLKTRITEGYFIHCKIEKPEFKTLEEADNWYKQQNWIAEKVVGSWVDDTIIVLEQSLTEYEAKVEAIVEGERKSVRELFPDAVKEPTPEFATLVMFKDGYNKAISDILSKLESL